MFFVILYRYKKNSIWRRANKVGHIKWTSVQKGIPLILINAFFNKVSRTFPFTYLCIHIIYYSPYHFSYKGLSIQKKWQIPIPHFFRLFHHLISFFFSTRKKKNNNTYLFIMIIFTSRIFYFIIEIFRPHAQSCRAQVLLSNQ